MYDVIIVSIVSCQLVVLSVSIELLLSISHVQLGTSISTRDITYMASIKCDLKITNLANAFKY